MDSATVAYIVSVHTPVTEVFRGKEDAGKVKVATFWLVIPAGILIILASKLGLKLVNRLPVNGASE